MSRVHNERFLVWRTSRYCQVVVIAKISIGLPLTGKLDLGADCLHRISERSVRSFPSIIVICATRPALLGESHIFFPTWFHPSDSRASWWRKTFFDTARCKYEILYLVSSVNEHVLSNYVRSTCGARDVLILRPAVNMNSIGHYLTLLLLLGSRRVRTIFADEGSREHCPRLSRRTILSKSRSLTWLSKLPRQRQYPLKDSCDFLATVS